MDEQTKAFAESTQINIDELQRRVRYLEKVIDTKSSPWYKRLWWRIDGWPAWYEVGPKRKRWWHK
jgi:hypothetical protein